MIQMREIRGETGAETLLRTILIGALFSAIPVATAIAWPAPETTPVLDGANWNSGEFDPLWISLSRAEDESISIDYLLDASEWPVRRARR